ncbi:MAG: alpha/beta hydrolase, partial [Gammaproteobacteria bacterium]|nr:alpha/beta hydrolase [Gammaproteobacteria bacterium]
RILFLNGEHPLIPGNRQEFEETLDFVFVKRPWIPAPMRRHLASVAAERQDLRRQIFADLLDDSGHVVRMPLNDIVTGLDIPTLVVWGRLDRVLHPGGATKLEALLDNETVELMSGVGHLPMLEQPKPTADRFLQFQRER